MDDNKLVRKWIINIFVLDDNLIVEKMDENI